MDDRFPIFKHHAHWLQDAWEGATERELFGVPTGLARAEQTGLVMFKEWPSVEEMRSKEHQVRMSVADAHGAKGAREISVCFSFRELESWCQGWFGHWTFDAGQEDQEFLCSFASFVDRKTQHNREVVGLAGNGWKPLEYALMGADDRWRWHATPEGKSIIGVSAERLPPPCRCEGCKRLGIVRIDH